MTNLLVPAWRHALQAQLDRHSHLPFSRFVQAATVRENGLPANRTVTFRTFLEDGSLLFTSDTRSDKYAQLALNPWAELCWYFVDSRVQVRLLGTMRILHTVEFAETRTAQWQERSDASRRSFTWPRPMQPRSPASDFGEGAPSLPPSNFGLLGFAPEQVDVLDLRSSPWTRIVHRLEEGNWTSSSVNP